MEQTPTPQTPNIPEVAARHVRVYWADHTLDQPRYDDFEVLPSDVTACAVNGIDIATMPNAAMLLWAYRRVRMAHPEVIKAMYDRANPDPPWLQFRDHIDGLDVGDQDLALEASDVPPPTGEPLTLP